MAFTMCSASLPHTMHCRRSHGVQKLEAKKVQPRRAGHHAAIMQRIACLIKYRKVDPREARVVPRAPDHIPYIERATVFQQWQSTFYAYHSADTLNPRSCEILGFNANERRSAETLDAAFAQ